MRRVPRDQTRPSRRGIAMHMTLDNHVAQEEPLDRVADESSARWSKAEPSTKRSIFDATVGEPLVAQRGKAFYSYPWLIERLSQTFFREWIGAWNVPTKIDHTDWLCTVCQEYTATWETRSGSYCKYCWSLERTSPLVGPTYMLEMIPLD